MTSSARFVPASMTLGHWRRMLRLLVRAVGTIVAATFLAFFVLERSIPGGFRAALLPGGESTSPRAQRLIERYHLDENFFVRYGHWLKDAVRGDFGRSAWSDEPVVDMLTHRIPITLELMLVGVLATAVIGVPLGILAALWSRRRASHALNALLGLSQSIPMFVTATILTAVFAVRLRWFPASGWTRISDSLGGNVEHLVLPLTALILAEVGAVARIVRADVLRELEQDYVAAAIGKGLGPGYVLFRHALRPASLGLVNVIALNIGALLGGAVVIELIFGIGGLGQLLLEASLNRDLPVVLGLVTFSVLVYVGLHAIVDVIVYALDPRIRRV